MQEARKFLGIEIGGTKLQLALSNVSGHIEQTVRYTIDAAGGAESIRSQVVKGLKELDFNNDLVSIGVGFGGPVNWKTGFVRVSHQVEGWADFNLAQWLTDITGKPATIENDANTAAFAEALHGSGKGHARVFYMTIGSGIGGGMIIDGEIYHGRQPGELEVGHIRLNKAGDTLEEKCCGWAVNKKVRDAISLQPNGCLGQLLSGHQGPEAALLQPALEEGDETAQKIVQEIADDLAFAISHVVHLFHPDIIVIGGGLSLLNQHLVVPVENRLPFYIMQAFLPPPPIHIASLGELVVPVGAIELARRNFSLINHTSL
jgi:glucokinase